MFFFFILLKSCLWGHEKSNCQSCSTKPHAAREQFKQLKVCHDTSAIPVADFYKNFLFIRRLPALHTFYGFGMIYLASTTSAPHFYGHMLNSALDCRNNRQKPQQLGTTAGI